MRSQRNVHFSYRYRQYYYNLIERGPKLKPKDKAKFVKLNEVKIGQGKGPSK
jgi:hypothetical protein